MTETKKRTPRPNKGGAALAAALNDKEETMTTAEGRLGFSQGYVSDAIKGMVSPSYSRRIAMLSVYGVEPALWDIAIKARKAVSP